MERIGMAVEKAVAAETEILAVADSSTGYLIYGILLTNADAQDAVATLTPVVNDADLDIPFKLDASTKAQSRMFRFPRAVRCQSLKATLVGTGCSMWIFYGV